MTKENLSNGEKGMENKELTDAVKARVGVGLEILNELNKETIRKRKTQEMSEDRLVVESMKDQILKLVDKGCPIKQIYESLDKKGVYKAKYATFRLVVNAWKKERDENNPQAAPSGSEN